MSKVKTCDKFCEGCAFCGRINGGNDFGVGYVYCRYLFITGQRRPCPAGEGCTAKKAGRARQKVERTPEEREALAELHRQRKRERWANRTEEQKRRQTEYNRAHYQKNKADRDAKHKAYYEANREKLNAYRRERRRKKREAECGS